MKVCVLGKVAQLLIEYAQALARDFVRIDVVDADLKILEARVIQSLNPIRGELITVRDQSRDDSV